jgi:hypothetical protein
LQVRAASSLKVMAFKVTLKTPSGDKVIECADDTYILDAAEEAGELAVASSRLLPARCALISFRIVRIGTAMARSLFLWLDQLVSGQAFTGQWLP